MLQNINKRVGKKVWLFENTTGWAVLNQDRVWTVESLHNPGGEYYDYHYTVSDGEEKRDVYWYETVVLPMESDDEELRIERYLYDNGCYCEYVGYEDLIDTTLYRFSVNWGDWKHDHGYLNSLMEYIGYELLNEIVTEENGSDCYSSEHVFVRSDEQKLSMLKELQKLFR
jgi:hypothetical protein